jgi:WD40 repeat protein
MVGHKAPISALVVTADGRRAISGSFDLTLALWDLIKGTELQVVTGHTGAVEALTVTENGTRLVSGSADQTLRVWDLAALLSRYSDGRPEGEIPVDRTSLADVNHYWGAASRPEGGSLSGTVKEESARGSKPDA